MNLVKFFEIAAKLKEVERMGWVERGVKNPESSSEHSFMVALMVLILGTKVSRDTFNRRGNGRKLDIEKALKMAVIHDLPEAIVGDIISKENWEEGGHMWGLEKASKELPAMKKLTSLSGDKDILELWNEFEGQKTPEARFVKDVDRLATIFQAVEYHRNGNYRKPLPPFWDEKGLSSVKDPELKRVLQSFLKTVKG
jgi:putative hydrolase of HD superfamily